MLFGKSNQETAESVSSTGDDNPLAGVVATARGYEMSEPEGEHFGGLDDGNRERVSDALSRLYTDERFHKHLVGLCRWTGRRKGLSSLQVDPSDESFRSASDVVYRRLVMRMGDRALAFLGNDALEDCIILVVGFGPLVTGSLDEIAQRRKAGAVSGEVQDEGEADE